MILRDFGDRSFYFPQEDETCWEVTKQEYDLPEWIITEGNRLLGRPIRAVVHAGANVGVYVAKYAALCDVVYGFEPEHSNWQCLCENTAGLENVFLFRAALSFHPGTVAVGGGGRNCGAHRVLAEHGFVPALNLSATPLRPDLIHLDCEGYEPRVIVGAQGMIEAMQPIIALEWRNQWRNYGIDTPDVLKQMELLGYELVSTYHHEALFAPRKS